MKRLPILLAMMAALPCAAQTADMSYSWLEADYMHVDQDNFDNANAMGLRGSGALGENFNIIGGWSKLNYDAPYNDPKTVYLGLGYHVPITDKTDLFAELAFVKETTFDEDGYNARVGVRSALTSRFEGSAWIANTKVDGPSSLTTFGVGGQYKFTPTFGVVAEVSAGRDEKSILVGPRLSF